MFYFQQGDSGLMASACVFVFLRSIQNEQTGRRKGQELAKAET